MGKVMEVCTKLHDGCSIVEKVVETRVKLHDGCFIVGIGHRNLSSFHVGYTLRI